ncbi:DNA photolyase [Abortiporus biennis]|nr:DNA photolyase [Abortiporus biennis]
MKQTIKNPPMGDAVVYWMRMEDLRIHDNRAFSQASAQAIRDGIPLVAMFILSPQDYVAHDRSARRIDFTLRNLRAIRDKLASLHIPLYVDSHTPRTTLPSHILGLLSQWNVSHLFANIEYEVDELRRDIKVCELAKKGGRLRCTFVHDRCVIPPGIVKTKEGRGYTVFSPFFRAWTPHLADKPDPLACAPTPEPNAKLIHDHKTFGELFHRTIPDSVEGFELTTEDAEQMKICWKEGEDAARELLHRFLYTKSRPSQLGAVDPLSDGSKVAEKNPKDSRVGKYNTARDRVDADTTSRLSPYLSAGIISARECIRETMELSNAKAKKVDVSRETGIGRWVQEVAWRDFYNHVLAFFPRVSMGRPFQEKFADVQWETNEGHLQAWKDGKTGVPIVDAGMRQANTMGWMHNRVRMVTAMYLVKDLMLDWRLGEKYFMETLIDGDLASNNGGWQWSASTGVDPVPYFRIFNPYNQSHKADPTGEYIRYFVPELAKVRGDDVHNPPAKLAEKLGYPTPYVKHNEARERAIKRYKNPGQA